MENFIQIWAVAMHPAAVRDGREHCLKTVHAGGSYNKQNSSFCNKPKLAKYVKISNVWNSPHPLNVLFYNINLQRAANPFLTVFITVEVTGKVKSSETPPIDKRWLYI